MEAILEQQSNTSTPKAITTKEPFFGKEPLIQRKLSIGASNDVYEQEADTMADKVVQIGRPQGNLQQQSGPLVQRKCEDCEEETLQKKGNTNDAGTASQALTRQIDSNRGMGQKMDAGTQNFMERRFGTNFSGVNIHTGSKAVQMSRDLNAQAFTVGNDIFFNEGKYNPSSMSGKHLLAHELTHTLQQKGIRRKIQRLKLTRHKFTKGDCGKRNVQWVFSLSNPAKEAGYLVQHIRSLETKKECPSNISHTELKPKLVFWEAWKIEKGKKVDWTTVRDSWTDGSVRPSNPNTSGTQTSLGTIKFFPMSVTGDLGDFGVAPSGKSDWGPGKVPTSGALPSTPNKPSWWDNTPTEGPAGRWASSWWNCCGSEEKHFSKVSSNP